MPAKMTWVQRSGLYNIHCTMFPAQCGMLVVSKLRPDKAAFEQIERDAAAEGYTKMIATASVPYQDETIAVLQDLGWETESEFINVRTTHRVVQLGKYVDGPCPGVEI